MNCRRALIINIVDHPNKDKIRNGSDIDRDKLKKTLEHLEYDIEIKENLTK